MRSLVRDAVPDYVRQAYDEVETQQRISHEVESGEVLDLTKMRRLFADFMKERRDAEFEELLETMRKNSAEINVAVEVAKTLSKTLPLNAPRTEVVERKIVKRKKTAEKPKPMVLELPRIALHGGNLNKVMMRWSTMRRLVNAEC
jgi:hypothetical protein